MAVTLTATSRASRCGTWRGWRRRCCRCWPTIEDKAVDVAQDALTAFSPAFEAAYFGGLRRKIGLATEQDGDTTLVNDLLKLMAENAADFTLTFRRLATSRRTRKPTPRSARCSPTPAAFDAWAARWRWRLGEESAEPAAIRAAMRAVNPAYIPRNHRVEAALNAAIDRRITLRSSNCWKSWRGRSRSAPGSKCSRSTGTGRTRIADVLRHVTRPAGTSTLSHDRHSRAGLHKRVVGTETVENTSWSGSTGPSASPQSFSPVLFGQMVRSSRPMTMKAGASRPATGIYRDYSPSMPAGAGSVQPFTAPKASPRTRWRCRAIMKTTIGNMIPTAAAADSDQ